MGRVVAAQPRGCIEHPHRKAVDHCDECRRPFCGECLIRGRPQLLCRACWDSAPAREARAARRRHPLYGRLDAARHALRERRDSAIAGAIIGGILAILAVTAAAQVRSPTFGLLIPEVAGRAARAASGRGLARSGQGVQENAQAARPSPVPYSTATALISGFWLGEAEGGMPFSPLPLVRAPGPGDAASWGWRSRGEMLPQELGFNLRETITLDRAAFRHTPAYPPETWAREVELLLSLSARDAGLVLVGHWTLGQTTAPQEFSFRPTTAKFVRLRLLTRHSDASFVSLGAFAIGAQGQDSGPLLPP
jgi:hypothetical protein